MVVPVIGVILKLLYYSGTVLSFCCYAFKENMKSFDVSQDSSSLVPTVSINSVCNNVVEMDSFSRDFRLLQTCLVVPTLRTCWVQQTN